MTSLDAYLKADPARCPGCGYHPPTQGHGRECTASATVRKSAGIAATTDVTPADDKARIDAAIARWAATGREFSANDLRREFAGVSGPVVGGRFNAAARRGLIRDTGKRVPSTLASTNGHEVRLWTGAAA